MGVDVTARLLRSLAPCRCSAYRAPCSHHRRKAERERHAALAPSPHYLFDRGPLGHGGFALARPAVQARKTGNCTTRARGLPKLRWPLPGVTPSTSASLAKDEGLCSGPGARSPEHTQTDLSDGRLFCWSSIPTVW